ncbi:hypothetical protein H4696_002309 [Amycolatopsis lexingtonensis]|uniref:Phosphoinositide phospholipase C, Ca2+-dependent n=1 Tax=Amycolatopsis lexingtonensis TaxID=218822 RepID=A0ABR9HWA8_9PSEU|nr:hypothetical protein [Amycolatopsis lexingtonensis]MBE1495209.1 hypothetical protein [Amycolatopsis lexingtonensis]
MIRLPALAVAALTASALLTGTAHAESPPFTASVFRATHNSYSGNVDGAKNSIAYQLDHGVRFIELDVHDNGYATTHDYGVGHDSPGNLVDHSGGNPASNDLRDWLTVVNTWSAQHPAAAPIVVMLDLKDDLTDNPSFAAGNLTAVNQELESVFGGRLLRAPDYAGQPTVDALRGRVLPLLSGDGTSRAEYKRDVGYHPAVALNGRGQIVEVHDSGAGALWYWTGTYGADGRVTWLRHGKYDSGQTPAVALNDNGDLVEVHQSQSATTLWYHVGKLGADGEITWQASHQYDNGVQPTVAFTDATHLREIHQSQSSSQNWTWNGALSATTVSWTGNAKTSDARFAKDTATSGARRVRVWTGADGPTPSNTLRADTASVAGDRIRYRQVAFDEFQKGDSAELQQGALFYGAPATESAFITSARQSGKLVRGWDFDSASEATTPLANYPATNHPYDAWYQSLLTGAAE